MSDDRPSLALLLTGFLRRADDTTEALWRHVAERFDTTWFVATWDVADNARTGVQSDRLEPAPVTTHDVVRRYGGRLADCRVLSYDAFERNRPHVAARDRPHDQLVINPRAAEHGTYWMDRLFAQWWVVRQGLAMVADHERLRGAPFDLICRTRTDILFRGALPSWPADRALVSAALPGGMASDRGWVPDFFVIGPGAEVHKLGEVCWSIERLYERQNIDTTNAENLLINVMVQQDIPLSIQSLPYERLH